MSPAEIWLWVGIIFVACLVLLWLIEVDARLINRMRYGRAQRGMRAYWRTHPYGPLPEWVLEQWDWLLKNWRDRG